MARPKKNDVQAAATYKIEAAFWQLLEMSGYSEITVRRISQVSETNRNSFYYHYENIEDLARTAFKNNVDEAAGLITTLLSAFRDSSKELETVSPEALSRTSRVMLCARSESPFLRRMVVDLLRDEWFGVFGIDNERLTPSEQLQVEFIFAGLAAVLGGQQVAQSPLIMPALAKSEIGRAAIGTLKAIASAQATRVD